MPNDTKLWVQYCRLELMYWEKLLLRRELLGIQATVWLVDRSTNAREFDNPDRRAVESSSVITHMP